MLKRSLSALMVISFFFALSPVQAQRRPARQSPITRTPPATPRPQAGKSLVHWVPQNAQHVVLQDHSVYQESNYPIPAFSILALPADLMQFLGLPKGSVSKSLTIRADTPGQLFGAPRPVYIIETDQAADVMKKFAERKTPTININGERVLAITAPAGTPYHLAQIDHQHLLFGVDSFFVDVLAVIRGRRASLYAAKPYVRPIFDVAQRSPFIAMLIATPEALALARQMLGLFGQDEGVDTILDMRVMAIDLNDDGKCAIVQHFQFEHPHKAINAYTFTALMSLIGQGIRISQSDGNKAPVRIEKGTLVSLFHKRTSEDCAGKEMAIDVSLRAFIPCDAVMALPPGVNHPRYLFKGDGYSGETSRASQIARVKFDPQQGPQLIEKNGLWEPSSYYENNQGRPIMNDRHWCWELLPGQKEKYAKRKKLDETPQNNNVSFERISDTQLRITFMLDGPNPVAPTPEFITPNLSAKISVYLRQEKGEKLQYLISGSHDGFPAYQLYISGQLVYCYDPLVSGADPWALLPPRDRRIDTTEWQYFPLTSAPIQFQFCKR